MIGKGRVGRVGQAVCACLFAAAPLGAVLSAQQRPRFSDRVDVSRVAIDVRALDGMGRPIRDLGADDFEVRIGGERSRVESATWLGGGEQAVAAGAGTDAAPRAAEASAGRLVVFLFQKDLEPARIIGLMRMLFRAQTFLETLGPDDQVAVLSFDSHLKIWSDFTNDREAIGRIFERGLLLERPRRIDDEPPAISLTRRLSQAAGRRAYPLEKGLRLLGEALEPLPGSKAILLFGHGFGRYTSNGVLMEPGYEEAVAALRRARAAVFSIDVTQADYHSLEAGLQLVSEATGGFYERTFQFPDRAVRRLVGALSGHYVLIVEPPRGGADADLDVRLNRVSGTVLVSSSVQ